MKRLKLLLIVASAAFSGCMSSTNLWQEGDRGTQFSNPTDAQRVISVPLDPYNPLAGRFDFTYFIRHKPGDPPKKTVLYIPGGPGEFVDVSQGENTPASFVVSNEYNQIYFHLRGSGRSQIDPSNQYDKYLRTTYAVHDIEEIRQDLIRQGIMRPDGKWDAIIAWSYGTVLAQQYTSLHQSHVDKLILISPLSNHNLAASAEKRRTEARQILRRTLNNIFDAKQYSILVNKDDPRAAEFFDLAPGDKLKILDTVFGSTDAYGTYTPGVIENVESAFGSLQFVTDNYGYLDKRGELKRYDLDRYPCSFFYSLHSLRLLGWIGDAPNLKLQAAAAKNIRDAILANRTGASANDCIANRPFSQRAFYSIGYRDGTNSRFVREYLANGRKDARDALRKSAGEAHEKRGINEDVEKLGMDEDDEIEPWDPANYKHSRPTLVLKGNADPIVVGDQAKHFLTDALLGPRILISFEGAGHELNLPKIKLPQAFHGTIALQKTRLPGGNVREVIGTATGIAFNKTLNLKLTPPNDLEEGLKVVGFGRALGASNGIKVLVNNITSRVIQGSAKVWKIDNDIFTGTTVLDIGTIESGETKELTGTLVPRGRGEKSQLELRPVAGWNPDLELECFQESVPLSGVFNVAPLFSNKSELPTTIPKLVRWTLGNEFFKDEFLWEDDAASVPPLQAHKGKPYAGIELPQYIVWELKGPGNFEACIPRPLAPGSPLKLKVYYSGQQPGYSLTQTWKIENPIFSGTLTVQLGSGMEDHKIRELPVTLDIVLGDWLKFGQPLAPRNSIEVIGYNVMDERRISLLLKNPGKWEMSVGDEGKEWYYALNSGHLKLLKGTCLALNEIDTRDCLIYAFLVMNPTQFSSKVDNPILREVERVLTSQDNQLQPKVKPLGVDNP